MKIILILFTEIIFSVNVYSQVPGWLWQKGAGSNGFGYDYGMSVAVNNEGDVFTTGSFYDTIQFGNTTLISKGSGDIFIVKCDSGGNVIWGIEAGGGYPDWAHGISTDNYGNCFIAGFFLDTIYFDNYMLVSNGLEPDIFVAKYDSNGNCLWARKAGGVGQDRAYAIKTDGNGNSYVTGYMNNNAMFGSIGVTSYGLSDIFIAKYDSAGNVIWVKGAGSADSDFGNGISIDGNHNCYVTGSFRSQAAFGSLTIPCTGSSDIFIAKFDSAGNEVWVRKAGGTNLDEGKAITTDSVGNSWITGSINYVAYFGNDSVISNGSGDIFVSKYDASGNILWVKHAGGLGNDGGLGIAYDKKNNCYVTGSFVFSATFGNITLPGNPGAINPFVVKYDNTGNESWGLNASCKSNADGHSIAVLDSDNIYITGTFSDTCYFGNAYITTNGYYDIYIAKLGQNIIQGISSNVFLNSPITMYPNPATQVLNITTGHTAIKSVEIYNVLGEKCMTSTHFDRENAATINISSLEAGIYFVKINEELNQYTSKLIIGAH